MVRNEKEYKEAIRRRNKNKNIIEAQKKALKKHGLKSEDINNGLAPLIAFNQEITEDIKWYEKAKKGELKVTSSLNEIGRHLIALRIASGLSQKELAKCLKVAEAQVSRDERNEYRGISLERIEKITSLFGVHFKTKVEFNRPLKRKNILAFAKHA